MVYHRDMRRFTIAAIAVIMLSSCTVTEDLSINGTGGIASSTDISVEKFFTDVLTDFAEFLPEDNSSIMDNAIASFGDGLANMAAINDAETVKTGEREYHIAFSIDDIDSLMAEFGVENQTLFEKTESSLSFFLDMNNYGELKQAVPFLADPNFEVYGPEYNQGMSEAEYLEMISFLLGEEGPDAIANGTVTMNITVPGTVTGAENAEITGDSTITYSFPIIAFLLLNEPLSFSVEWQ